MSAGSAEVTRKPAAAGCASERTAVRRGSLSEGDSGSVVSCSHPEPSATILGKTRISRPRRKPGGLAGRAEYPGRQRAPPGQARAPGRDAGTRGGAGTQAGDAALRPASPRGLRPPPPAGRRRRRRGRWEGEVARGSSASHQDPSPSCDWAEGAMAPLSHCCLIPERREYTPKTLWSPHERWRAPWSTQPRNVYQLGTSRFCWGTSRHRKYALGSSKALSPAARRTPPVLGFRPQPLSSPSWLCKHCRRSPRVRARCQGTKVICSGSCQDTMCH